MSAKIECDVQMKIYEGRRLEGGAYYEWVCVRVCVCGWVCEVTERCGDIASVCHNTVRWNSLEVFSRVLNKLKPERFPKTKVKILIQEHKPISKNRMWNAEVLWSLRKVRDPKSAATSNCILIVVVLMIWANIDRSFWITWRLFFKRTVVWTSAVLKCLKAPFIN